MLGRHALLLVAAGSVLAMDMITAPPKLLNCATLFAGKFNLHWQLLGDDRIVLGLEGKHAENQWMAFGIPQSASVGAMVNSDAIVAGNVAGKPFAFDYFLSSKCAAHQPQVLSFAAHLTGSNGGWVKAKVSVTISATDPLAVFARTASIRSTTSTFCTRIAPTTWTTWS
jgi:hypothetical protein